MTILRHHCFIAAATLGWLLLFLLPASVCFGVAFQDRTAQFYAPGLGSWAGHKAAWGDYNKDGWVDLLAGGEVLTNNGGNSFSGSSLDTDNGVWGDYNNDGHLDLFYYGSKRLFRYTGAGGWDNVSSKIPPFGTHASQGAAWADLNNDGHLDLYVGGYEVWETGTTYPDRILTYNKTSQQFDYNWSETVYRARGVTAADFDRDGDQDVYVSNYRLQPNRLLRNNGTGGMTDVAGSYGVAGGAHTIGSAWGDFDNDGLLDLFVGNFSHPGQEPAHFLRNLGPGGSYHFQNMKDLSGGDWQESYASPALADYDNDGDLDLFITTVYGGNYPRLYSNDGSWNFTDVTASVGLNNLGPTYQAAWGDVDNDGDLDLATDGKLFINDADANGNHWLKIKVEGDGTTVNRSAIGAQVRVSTDGGLTKMTRQVEGGTGEGNQNDLTLHYGLGSHSGTVDVDILRPDGTSQTFTGVATDQVLTIPLTIPEPSLVFQEDFNGTAGTAVDGWNGWVLAGGPSGGVSISSTVIDQGNSAAWDTGHGMVYHGVEKGFSFSPAAGSSYEITTTFLAPTTTIDANSDYADLRIKNSSSGAYVQIALGYDYLIFGDGTTAWHEQPQPTTATDVRVVITDTSYTGSYRENGTSVWTVGPTLAHTVPISGYDTINLSGAGQPFMDSIQLMGTGTVPEPTTLVLVLTGLIGLLAYAWWKRK